MDAVVPAGPRWCCTSSLVPTLLCCPTGSTGCPLCPTGVLKTADRSCGSSTLGPHWLQLRTASVKIDLQQPRSEASTWSTCTLNSGWAGLGWAGLGWVFAVQSMMTFEEQRATIHHDAPYIPIHYWCSGIIAACAMNKRVDVCYRGSVEGP